MCNFSLGSTTSLGTYRISLLFAVARFFIEVHIIDDLPPRLPLPILMSLVGMDRLRLLYDNTVNLLIRRPSLE